MSAVVCILVCAGSGSRMGSLGACKSKVLLELKPNWTVLHEGLSRVLKSRVTNIILVCSEELQADFQKIIKSFEDINSQIVIGGSTRSESVQNGLTAVPKLMKDNIPKVVFVHDGARPFFSVDLLKKAISLTIENGEGFVFGMPVVNTIKLCSEELEIKETLNRDQLWEVQTPQVFSYSSLKEAYGNFDPADTIYDDSSLVERAGKKVSILKSDSSNFKITTQADIDRAMLYFQSLDHN